MFESITTHKGFWLSLSVAAFISLPFKAARTSRIAPSSASRWFCRINFDYSLAWPVLPPSVFHHNLLPRHAGQILEAAGDDLVGQLAHVAEIAVRRALARQLAAQVLAQNVRRRDRDLLLLAVCPHQ